MFKFLLVSSIAVSPLWSGENYTEEQATKRVYGHLFINDRISAVKEAKKALEEFPNSKNLQVSFIRALCEKGDEIEAWEQWQRGVQSFQEELKSRHMLEVIAWGVLNKGETSSQLSVCLTSLLGAAFTRDAKAIPLLIDGLRSSNAFLRSIAVKLSVSYGDTPLQNEIERLLKEEKVWYVRLEVIQAVGQLRMGHLRTQLEEILGNPKSLAEERAAAIVSLVSIYDKIDRQKLRQLMTSNRAGLRQLGCEVISHLNLVDHIDLMIPLLQDTSSDVRLSALNVLGLLRVKKVGETKVIDLIQKNLKDPFAPVSITAAWVALLLEAPEGETKLGEWLDHENLSWQRLSSAAIAASGKYGVKLSLKYIKGSKDPYVKVNLALGLIGQRVEVKQSCQIIDKVFFAEKSQLWMWDNGENPLFRSLAPSEVHHIEQIPHYPMVVDQMTRLELLSVLSILRYPKAQAVVRSFLQTHSWGVTGAAAATLLQEGDEEDLTAVSALLEDPDEKIRIQAALILALVGSDPRAVKILQEAYHNVDREMKVHILEALAHIGDPSSIPFLLEILKEPFQILRVVAASALIQCLYH